MLEQPNTVNAFVWVGNTGFPLTFFEYNVCTPLSLFLASLETIFKLLNLESNSFFAPFNVKFIMYNLGKKFINNIIKVMIHTALFLIN